jgi:asparagine synthase (glutamine-hydrolysing)
MEALLDMREALVHRGPDDCDVVVVQNVGLVHTRLSIVDISERAHQPMRHPNGSLWLGFNGEIFNHQELRSELRDVDYTSTSDTETLLHAFDRWGTDVLPRLNGQFAFGAVDLERGRVTLARDRFGIKPLYVLNQDDGFWFASEPGALLAIMDSLSPRAAAWPSIVNWSCYRSEDTIINGVRQLPPGSYLEIPLDGSLPTFHRWYTPARSVSARRQGELARRERSSLTTQLTMTLRAAVHDALMGDVPMGTLCSGGVDSSLITALAAEAQPNLVAFSATYRGDRTHDESWAAAKVAHSLGIELDMLEVTKEHWRSGFVDATVHFGGPIATASSVTIAQMALRARNRGIKVVLTGEGADELFGGYSDPLRAPLGDFLSPFERSIRRLEPRIFGYRIPTRRAIARRFLRLLNGSSTTPSLLPGEDLSSFMEQDGDVLDEISSAYSHNSGARRAVEVSLIREFHFTLSHLLNRMDTNLMQYSVEARVPFLDPRVVDLVLNLPLESRVTPWNKGVLRDVAKQLLPGTIARRAKVYGMDYDAGSWIEETADPNFLREGIMRELFDIPGAQFSELLARAYGSLRVRLWSTEVWCRSAFAGHSAATIDKDLWAVGS